MDCPQCSALVEKGAQFCPKCYARIDPPSLWQRFLSLFQREGPRKSVITIKKRIDIKTTDKEGQHHEYHSLDEVPPELRADLEKLQSEAEKEALTGASPTSRFVTKKTISIFRVKDASGKEHIYHSLDELPPDIRAAFEKAQGKVVE
jgi:RNA polymerase subunit RPABC4/transcription elongation factor Spt4